MPLPCFGRQADACPQVCASRPQARRRSPRRPQLDRLERAVGIALQLPGVGDAGVAELAEGFSRSHPVEGGEGLRGTGRARASAADQPVHRRDVRLERLRAPGEREDSEKRWRDAASAERLAVPAHSADRASAPAGAPAPRAWVQRGIPLTRACCCSNTPRVAARSPSIERPAAAPCPPRTPPRSAAPRRARR